MYIGLAPDWLTDLLNDITNVQHRWAPAFLAARHHIYFFHLLLYMSYLANKIVHQAKENKAVNISSNNRPAAAEI